MWQSNDDGIGTPGSEGGVIILNLEHSDGARVSLKKGASVAPYAITMGIYGRMMHTVFCADYEEAVHQVTTLKPLIEQAIAYAEAGKASEMEHTIDQIAAIQ